MNCAEWDRAHPYCFAFETLSNWEPRLRLGINADQQFHRVTYGTSRQRAVVAQVIREVVSSVNKHCRGTLEGGFANSLVTILARIVAQCLIDIISGFKSQCYRSEDEWRIVCRPNIRLASAASGLEDDAFRLYIKGGHTPRRTRSPSATPDPFSTPVASAAISGSIRVAQ